MKFFYHDNFEHNNNMVLYIAPRMSSIERLGHTHISHQLSNNNNNMILIIGQKPCYIVQYQSKV